MARYVHTAYIKLHDSDRAAWAGRVWTYCENTGRSIPLYLVTHSQESVVAKLVPNEKGSLSQQLEVAHQVHAGWRRKFGFLVSSARGQSHAFEFAR